jgi:S-formylglutathione hydrolase FrmB
MALIHTNFFSESLGMCVAVDVILPQASNRLIGMETTTTAEKHPVLWLLHGASDNHTIWQRRTSIERYVAPLGLAVVTPNAHLSSYADMAHGGKYFTYMADELPRLMRTFFPLSDKRGTTTSPACPWAARAA